jgi:hypothetical protein
MNDDSNAPGHVPEHGAVILKASASRPTAPSATVAKSFAASVWRKPCTRGPPVKIVASRMPARHCEFTPVSA